MTDDIERGARPAVPPVSFWAPFASTPFLVIWSATLLGNLATAMRELGAAWLMTTLSVSSAAVGMVKAAAAFPVLLLALPAGALADTINRRSLNIWINAILAVVTAAIGQAALTGALTPALLIAAILVTGVGSALLQPTQQSLVPLLVERERLEQAVALNGMGLNISRAIGPAIAGVTVAALGVAAAFYANALGYLVVIAAFLWWKGASTPASGGLRESLPGAMAAGVRFVRHAPELRRVLARLGGFVLLASAYWTLLPVLVRRELAGTPGLYGYLLAAIGIGTAVTTFSLPWLRRKFSTETIFRLGLGGTVLGLLGLALVRDPYSAALIGVVLGMSWLASLTMANVAAQSYLPDWMRGRGMAIYLMVFAGAMTLGSPAWGTVADQTSVRLAFLAAGTAGVALLVAVGMRPLPELPPDLKGALHWWPEPHVHRPVPGDRGPVMVSIEYQVDPRRAGPFLILLREISQERLRDGAYQWGVYEDVTVPGRYVESFLFASWAEHDRQYHRLSRDDARREAMIVEFHLGPEPPVVRHLVAPPGV
ncbi:MAG: MFS transporter [Burkholderiales bacterium]|nr:MFS transporter [Burkholderiales bacterium]